jgi:hypothetical protein
VASHSRIAFSSMASNTGARSPGEELMTPSTSAVAVCCSSASRNARSLSLRRVMSLTAPTSRTAQPFPSRTGTALSSTHPARELRIPRGEVAECHLIVGVDQEG